MEAPKDVIDMYEKPFSLFESSPAGEAPATALHRSTHLQATPLSQLFFDARNVDKLQRLLVDAIRSRTGYVVDRQSDQELLVVMRYVFVQSARGHGGAAEVRRLNELVLKEIVPMVGAGLAQYLAYLRDASTMHTPIPRGQATSIKGTKTTQLFRGL